ncbi:hypothetical protein PHSY_001908 [Pseudozyma hubeiensis SY62]|uniref:Uncharacterized protein n=1 Tax=Pseudozyma hubeiensis (strain SY62) TaxID=1305764 RepID=R9P034_PSEHS|nr:hypothetical protein PHSY_001908 [Pseudozyma hubeiensis SY62]GAC94337.1 hypothetical protein PHSY_001908 [Pseudozyma hubeiensis SY62]
MAVGLFASLFAASPTSSSSEPSVPSRASHLAVSDSDATSDEIEQCSPVTSQNDVVITDAEPMDATSTSAAMTVVTNTKEAQDVADVDMQLSSPPSSPPPTAPSTPQHRSPATFSAVRTVKTEASSSSSSSAQTASSNSPDTALASESSLAAGRPGPSSTPMVQRALRRRTMPARLSQVSSLLAGSMLEEELMLLEPPSSPSASSFHHNSTTGSTSKLDGAVPSVPTGRQGPDSSSEAGILTSSSLVVLTSDSRILARAIFPNAPSLPADTIVVKAEHDDSDLALSAPTKSGDLAWSLRPVPPSSFASLVSTLAIKRQQLIETPDFKQRDDTLYMPKTRGLRSEAAEDTSDAAYERRHRKPETAEKRQRKAEVDRLSKDRLKLLTRIDQIKTAEARLLQSIVVARDQVRSEANGQAEASLSEPNSRPLSKRIEDVRKELLDDAYETLKRYDLLLSTTSDAKLASPGPAALSSRTESATAADDVSRSESPRLKIRIKGGRATWETADSASPTAKQPPASHEKSDPSRRVSARQPKHRVESLPTPLTSAAVDAAEHDRRKRRRSSGANDQEASAAGRRSSAFQADDTPAKGMRRRGSPEVGGTYKGKAIDKEQDGESTSSRRPQRAAAAAAAVASARQGRYAERSFSDFDYDDEDEDEQVESVLNGRHNTSPRRASHSIRRSSVKSREQRSPSASSTTSSVSSLASSIGYMYPTVADTGSLKVSQSLAEIQASDPEATSSDSALTALESSPGTRKKLKLVLSQSPSAKVGLGSEVKRALSEAFDSSDMEQEVSKGEKGRALTESEAESILAAFLGTTPLGKKPANTVQIDEDAKASSSGTSLKAATKLTAQSSAAASQQPSNNASTPSKRRSSRRNTTQSFGEKLPDLLTKQAPFDFTVMGYFRSIDKPSRNERAE